MSWNTPILSIERILFSFMFECLEVQFLLEKQVIYMIHSLFLPFFRIRSWFPSILQRWFFFKWSLWIPGFLTHLIDFAPLTLLFLLVLLMAYLCTVGATARCFMSPFDTIPVIFDNFLAFWNDKIFRFIL